MTNTKKIFRGQKDGEKVVMMYHKHWFSFIKPVVIFLPIFLVSVAILYYQHLFGSGFLILGFVLFLLSVFYLLYNFLIWWKDVYILTNIRVIDCNQKTLFHKVVSEADLGNIQDTTYEIEGLWQTVLNYGQVKILTASAGQSICFQDVPNPEEIQQTVLRVKDEMRK